MSHLYNAIVRVQFRAADLPEADAIRRQLEKASELFLAGKADRFVAIDSNVEADPSNFRDGEQLTVGQRGRPKFR